MKVLLSEIYTHFAAIWRWSIFVNGCVHTKQMEITYKILGLFKGVQGLLATLQTWGFKRKKTEDILQLFRAH